jgi:hypothetical protein
MMQNQHAKNLFLDIILPFYIQLKMFMIRNMLEMTVIKTGPWVTQDTHQYKINS